MSKHRTRLSHLTLGHTLRVLLSGRFTRHEIEAASGITTTTAYIWIRALRKMRLIHIADWETDAVGRDAVPIFELGDRPDRRRRKLSAAERSKRYRENLKLKQEK